MSGYLIFWLSNLPILVLGQWMPESKGMIYLCNDGLILSCKRGDLLFHLSDFDVRGHFEILVHTSASTLASCSALTTRPLSSKPSIWSKLR